MRTRFEDFSEKEQAVLLKSIDVNDLMYINTAVLQRLKVLLTDVIQEQIEIDKMLRM